MILEGFGGVLLFCFKSEDRLQTNISATGKKSINSLSLFLHLCKLKHEPCFKGIQELVCNMYFMYLSHPQQVQPHGMAGTGAQCNPKSSLSHLEEMANTFHSIFSFPHTPSESKRKFTSARTEPRAFSKTAGKASAHLPKTPIFTPEEHLRARSHSFSPDQNRERS